MMFYTKTDAVSLISTVKSGERCKVFHYLKQYKQNSMFRAKDSCVLNKARVLINAKSVNSANFRNRAHFMSVVAIIATKNWTEDSVHKVAGNRLVCIIQMVPNA